MMIPGLPGALTRKFSPTPDLKNYKHRNAGKLYESCQRGPQRQELLKPTRHRQPCEAQSTIG
ncbi:MAG: hypothetical protein CMJ70_00300 [Planctomycetaceae bacterium]|nr:hypothetical protein [Planctomycetaceae bacterium]